MKAATQKAHILIEAIKYIKQFEGKVIVVKYGGNAMENAALKASVFEDISALSQLGLRVVVVHGGGPKIDYELRKQGLPAKFIEGLRVTDNATMEVVAQVLQSINQDCVAGLLKAGIKARDYTPGSLLTRVVDSRLGRVGNIRQVKTGPLFKCLASGVIPVVSSLGTDDQGWLTNINADTAASKIAIALEAEKLTVLTDVDSVVDRHKQRIRHISVAEVEQYIASGIIDGGMIPKVRACAEAAAHGVGKAHLLNGTIPRALLLEIYTAAGIGTEIVR